MTGTGEGRPGGDAPLDSHHRPSQDMDPVRAALYGGPYYRQMPVPVATVNSNGKAIASLVVGIFGLASLPIIASIIALVLGYQARKEIAGSGGWQTGETLARAGIILGWVGIALYVLLILVIVIIAVAAPDSFSSLPPI